MSEQSNYAYGKDMHTQGIKVFLEKDVPTEQAIKTIELIRQIKGVADAEPIYLEFRDLFARQNVKFRLQDKLIDVIGDAISDAFCTDNSKDIKNKLKGVRD